MDNHIKIKQRVVGSVVLFLIVIAVALLLISFTGKKDVAPEPDNAIISKLDDAQKENSKDIGQSAPNSTGAPKVDSTALSSASGTVQPSLNNNSNNSPANNTSSADINNTIVQPTSAAIKNNIADETSSAPESDIQPVAGPVNTASSANDGESETLKNDIQTQNNHAILLPAPRDLVPNDKHAAKIPPSFGQVGNEEQSLNNNGGKSLDATMASLAKKSTAKKLANKNVKKNTKSAPTLTTKKVSKPPKARSTNLSSKVPLSKNITTTTRRNESKLTIQPAASSTVAASTRDWLIKMGTFSSPFNAKSLVDKLGKAGFKASTSIYKTSTQGVLTQVLVGPVSTREEATRLVQDINSKVGVKGFVINGGQKL